MNVVLLGLKGVGKTHYGKLLSKKIDWPFIDTDHEIEKRFFLKEGRKIGLKAIYKNLGEEAFRNLEEEVITHLKERKNSVISIGGGGFLRKSNRDVIERLGCLISLYCPKEELKTLWKERPQFLVDSASYNTWYDFRSSILQTLPTIPIYARGEKVLEEIEEAFRRCYGA